MARLGGRNRWLLLSFLCLSILAGVALGGWIVRPTTAGPLERGISAYDRQDWSSAEKAAREQLKNQPDDPQGMRLLARSLVKLERDQPALALWERLGDSRLEAEDFYLLAQALLRSGQGKSEAAIQLWQKAVAKDPKHESSLVALERVYFHADLLSEAAKAAEKLAGLPGWQARANLMLGQIGVAQSDPAAAVNAYRIALHHTDEWHGLDDLDHVRKQMARMLLRIEKPAEARAELLRLSRSGDDPETGWLLSRCDLQEGVKSDKAVLARAQAYRESHPIEPEPAPFVGEGRCAECHQAIFQEQHRSRHARTFPRGDQLRSIPFPEMPRADPTNPRVTHSFVKTGEKVEVQTRVDGQVFKTIVDYAFGSGDRGLTLVGHDKNDQFYEYRLSYYAPPVGWDVTSGHPEDPAIPAGLYQGMTLNADAVRRCFECHATHPHAVLANVGPEASDKAIGCERCHGPGGNHLKSVGALKASQISAAKPAPDFDLSIARPALTSGSEIVGLCSQCHSPRANLIKLSPGSPDSIRFQGATLTWSRCYTESGNKLDCVICHDPHRNLVTSAGWYESRCLQCHSSGEGSVDRPIAVGGGSEHPAKTSCPVEPTKNCLNCHMPKISTPMAHARFTDHFIRVHRESETTQTHEKTTAR